MACTALDTSLLAAPGSNAGKCPATPARLAIWPPCSNRRPAPTYPRRAGSQAHARAASVWRRAHRGWQRDSLPHRTAGGKRPWQQPSPAQPAALPAARESPGGKPAAPAAAMHQHYHGDAAPQPPAGPDPSCRQRLPYCTYVRFSTLCTLSGSAALAMWMSGYSFCSLA
jgi:hypothetical protein